MIIGNNSVHFPGGKHLIIDLWGCPANTLNNPTEIEKVLRSACEDAGATVLFSNMHHFGGEYGVTGVVALSESHCSIHTWPEDGYASIDVYMCGNCDPRNSLARIKTFFTPSEVYLKLIIRGSKKLESKRVAA